MAYKLLSQSGKLNKLGGSIIRVGVRKNFWKKNKWEKLIRDPRVFAINDATIIFKKKEKFICFSWVKVATERFPEDKCFEYIIKFFEK